MYAALDVDSSGTVEKEEIEGIVKDSYPPIYDTLTEADTDNDGAVSQTEWTDLLTRMIDNFGIPGPGEEKAPVNCSHFPLIVDMTTTINHELLQHDT